MSKINITERFIKTLTPPASGNVIYWDEKLSGFGIRITANKAISFVFRYRNKNREQKNYTIGRYPQMYLSFAKEKCLELYGDIIKGLDPLEQKHKINKDLNLKELADEYLEYSKNRLKPKSISNYKQILTAYILPAFERAKITLVNKTDILKFHTKLADKKYTANRAFELLKVLFNYAINSGYIEANPCKGIKKYTEDTRERYLSDDEASRILAFLQKHKDSINIYAIKLLLLTGSRKGEVLNAQWKQFDLERMVWIKPASHTKQRKISVIPLNPQTIEVLLEMKGKIGAEQGGDVIITSEYLFYNRAHKKPLADIKRFWNSLIKETQIQDLHIHDLRHYFASILINNGVIIILKGKIRCF